ncbi:uncharacterized protein (DUF362 family)/Pyruvate/2-oxoacid:ferredoxin oxidoreductase delta subunit [Methanolinea mesophila]|uniref:DUF362 domain-containing protein n=1 Tax=Methanolinea mesophila TaxID=547055 RepID=UPI001AE9AB4A|nr:uncharacterized protein (DUF362 family)/Pyruvate/2-oxoacid:ferredoxin oxidoreductase delta subunit [Methanolinea mesophila]
MSIVSCPLYRPGEVTEAVRRAVDLLGGIGRFIPAGSQVMLKPNLLQGLPPERAVATHPEVIRAVALLLIQAGATVTLADSPGGGIRYTSGNLRHAYDAAGYARVAEELGFTLNFSPGYSVRSHPDGEVVKQFPLIDPVLGADTIVSVSKAKGHILTLLTGATKNLFGVIPGLEKPVFHARFPEPERFAGMLLDLHALLRPALHIVDAVVGMEGDGPTGGDPRQVGVILAGTNAVAVDYVLCRVLGMEPLDVPVIRAAVARGWLDEKGADIAVLGEPLEHVKVRNFKKPSTYRGEGKGIREKRFLRALYTLGRVYAMRPRTVRHRCTCCGKCAAICPAGAIRIERGGAVIDLSRCIRCYCCHEMCTDNAIMLEQGIAGKVMAKIIRA